MVAKLFIAVVIAIVVYWCWPSTYVFDQGIALLCFFDYLTEELIGKRVVVTGASSGTGEQIAYYYARLGASVFTTARREHSLQQVVKRCKELGREDGTFGYIAADMSNMEDTSKVIQKAVDSLGGIDHLVLNHAWLTEPDLWKGTQENMTKIYRRIDVNFFSFIHLFSHALPYLQNSEKGAFIAVVSSIYGKLPSATLSAYAASKFALDGFFSSVREEFRYTHCNMTITLCILGGIDTEAGREGLRQGIGNFKLDSDSVLSYISMASPEDTAYAIVRATALGESEMYYPRSQYIKQVVQIRHIFPGLLRLISDMVVGTYQRDC